MGSRGRKRKGTGVDVGLIYTLSTPPPHIENKSANAKMALGLAIMETLNSETVRNQLEKILASEGFARNDRISSFLQFVVEQELSGSGNQLKESVIGVEVFGRRPDYDVRQDSIVRTEAGKLRIRLAKYYAGEEMAGQVVIDLPKGGYRPVFRNPEVTREEAAASRWPKHRWRQL